MSVLKSNKLYCSHHSASKAPSMHMHVLVFCLFLCCGFVVDLSSHEYKCFGILICTVNSTPSSAQQTSLCGSTCYDPSKHRCCEKTQTSSAGMRLAVFDVQPSIVAWSAGTCTCTVKKNIWAVTMAFCLCESQCERSSQIKQMPRILWGKQNVAMTSLCLVRVMPHLIKITPIYILH